MTNRPLERLPIAISLGLFVGLAHLAVLTTIGFSVWKYIHSPAVQCPMEPMVDFAQVFQRKLVYPLYMMPNEDPMALRFVDLVTGNIRDTDFLGILADRGLVTDGKTLWGIGSDDQIYETDGTTAVIFRTKQKLTAKLAPWDRAFLYEGSPAVIDHDDNNVARLVVLVNREWEDRGQIALPRVDQIWTLDEQTGEPAIVPSLSATPTGNNARWRRISVIPAQGQYHLFRTETIPGKAGNQQTNRVSHRVGFDFVLPSGQDEPASAFNPANAPSETTGWELLALTIGRWNGCAVMHNDELFFAGREGIGVLRDNIWRQVAATSSAASARFESLMTFDHSGGHLNLVSSVDTNEFYALAQPRLGEIDVYRFDNHHFEKLPYQIDGVVTPMVRQAGRFLSQILAVLWLGTLISILGAGWLTNLTGQSSFSFGQETVALAPLFRRSVARAIDLVLALSPALVYGIWRVSQTNSERIFSAVVVNPHVSNPDEQFQFVPVLVWGSLVWMSLVVSTAIWGVSPGKWLCRIRVIRSTLRPCGFTRALLRELMLWLDAPLLLTGLPAVISWLATDHRQRIGDLVADTVVIVESLPEFPMGEFLSPAQQSTLIELFVRFVVESYFFDIAEPCIATVSSMGVNQPTKHDSIP